MPSNHEDHTVNWLLLIAFSCATRTGVSSNFSGENESEGLVPVLALPKVVSLDCEDKICTIRTPTSEHRLDVTNSQMTEVETPNSQKNTETEVWPLEENPDPLGEQWNRQISQTWRSPFRREIPSPDGGSLRMIRGLSEHTSRIMRVGGKVVVARQAPPPDGLLYPRIMALHPTGQEAYLIVWPNPDLIAFQPNSLETNWRIRLGAPALGLFVSENGRFLVAETGGVAPEEQLLDYEGNLIDVPIDQDPISDQALAFMNRPSATHTMVIDLALGSPVARLPGRFIGFEPTKSGAVVASTDGVSIITAADQ